MQFNFAPVTTSCEGEAGSLTVAFKLLHGIENIIKATRTKEQRSTTRE